MTSSAPSPPTAKGPLTHTTRRHDGLPEELRRQIPVILRHYPSTLDIEHQARHGDDPNRWGGPWLAPEEKG